MSKYKAAVGVIFMVGLPLAFALLFAGLGYRYANQHVHDVSARLVGDGRAVVHVNDYHHSTGGIIAVSGAFALAVAALTVVLVLAGGAMYAARDKPWD